MNNLEFVLSNATEDTVAVTLAVSIGSRFTDKGKLTYLWASVTLRGKDASGIVSAQGFVAKLATMPDDEPVRFKLPVVKSGDTIKLTFRAMMTGKKAADVLCQLSGLTLPAPVEPEVVATVEPEPEVKPTPRKGRKNKDASEPTTTEPAPASEPAIVS